MKRNDKAYDPSYAYQHVVRLMGMWHRRGSRQGHLERRPLSQGPVLMPPATLLGLLIVLALSLTACTPERLAVKGTTKIVTAPVKIIF